MKLLPAFVPAYFNGFRLLSLVAAGALGVAAAGCGDDSAAGPAIVDQDGTLGGLDSALGGDSDATTSQDVAVMSDGLVAVDVVIGATDAATVGGDDAPSTPDATVVNPAASCTGKCGVYDKKALCQCDDKCTSNGDCCGDYNSLCGAVAATCGDGKCAGTETATNCPGDCGTVTPPTGSCAGKCGQYDKTWSCQCDTKCASAANNDCCGDLATACPATSPIVTCVETNCPTDVAACTADPACAKVLDCAKNCTDQNCLFGCVGGSGGFGNLPPALQGVYNCGNKANCFQGGGPTAPVCGDGKCDTGETAASCPKDCGTTTPPVCGDGKCDAGETAANCPKDCGSTGTPTLDQCIQSNCTASYTKCAADPACLAGLACVEGGKQIWNCVTDWQIGLTLGQVQACAGQNGCFTGTTGGGGGGGTPPTGSCAGICGQFNTSGGLNACQCQSWCTQAGNCCSDYQALCVNGGSTAKCGDGVCASAAGETATTCPADCGTTPTPAPCKTKSDCTGADVCCAQAAGNVCLPAAQCK